MRGHGLGGGGGNQTDRLHTERGEKTKRTGYTQRDWQRCDKILGTKAREGKGKRSALVPLAKLQKKLVKNAEPQTKQPVESFTTHFSPIFSVQGST